MRPAIAVLLFIGTACGSSQPPPIGDTDATTNVTIIKTGSCAVEGETIACQVVTGQSGGVTNCFHGVQTCTNGQWGPCGEPSDGGETKDASTSDVTTTDATTSDADVTDAVASDVASE